MFTIVFYIIYLYMLYRFISKAYKLEELSPLEARVMPKFAFIMLLIHMEWRLSQLLLLIPIFLVSLAIAYLQVSRVDIQDKGEQDKHGRPIILIRKNTPYVIGWFLIVLAGVLLAVVLEGEHLSTSHFVQELFTEVRKESLKYFFFSQHSDWYIWALTAFTNFTFTRLLIWKCPAIKEAIRKK